MTEKTVIISKFNEPLDVKSVVAFNCVIADDADGFKEQEVNVEYDNLTPAQKLKIDDALEVLEAYIPD